MVAGLFDATLRLAAGLAGASTVTAGSVDCATAKLFAQSVVIIQSTLAAENHAILLYDFDTRIPQACPDAFSQQSLVPFAAPDTEKQPSGG
jgi:hypothetical protein